MANFPWLLKRTPDKQTPSVKFLARAGKSETAADFARSNGPVSRIIRRAVCRSERSYHAAGN